MSGMRWSACWKEMFLISVRTEAGRNAILAVLRMSVMRFSWRIGPLPGALSPACISISLHLCCQVLCALVFSCGCLKTRISSTEGLSLFVLVWLPMPHSLHGPTGCSFQPTLARQGLFTSQPTLARRGVYGLLCSGGSQMKYWVVLV